MRKLIYILLLFTSFSWGQSLMDLQLLAQQQTGGVGCSADPNEQNTTAGVTSDPNCNESNNITNWLQSGAAAVTASVESSDVSEGDYALKLVADVGGTEFRYISVAGSTGHDYTISFDIKQTVGSNGSFYVVGASPTGTYSATGSWTTHSFSTTASSTMVLRFYPAGSGGAGDSGDTILVDNLSIIQTD